MSKAPTSTAEWMAQEMSCECGWHGTRGETDYDWSSDDGASFQCPDCSALLEDL